MLSGLTSFPFPSRRLLLPRLLLGFLLLPTNLVWFPVLPIPVDAKLLDPETGAQARSYFGPLQPITVQGQALSCSLDSVPSLPSLPAAPEANPPPLSLWTASSMLLPGHLLPSSPSMIEIVSQDRSDHALSRSKPSSAFPRGQMALVPLVTSAPRTSGFSLSSSSSPYSPLICRFLLSPSNLSSASLFIVLFTPHSSFS